jgi:hypothetical protein
MKKPVTVTEAVATLNELVALDRDVMDKLVKARFITTTEFSNHPTVQCGRRGPNSELTIGLLGVLNAIFGIDSFDWGYVAVDLDDDGNLLKFKELVGDDHPEHKAVPAIKTAPPGATA